MKSGKYTKRLSRTKRMVFIYLPLLTFQIRLTPTTNKNFYEICCGKIIKLFEGDTEIFIYIYSNLVWFNGIENVRNT